MELTFTAEHRYRYLAESEVPEECDLCRAQDLVLGRDVALKRVRITGDTPREREDALKRAVRELKTMVQVARQTPQIPAIHEYWVDEKNGVLYIVMQWIEGESLEEKMKKHADAEDRTVTDYLFLGWMCELVKILQAMERENHFHHKDIKPQNILFDRRNGALCLIDFNLSVSAPNREEGTPAYRAPEMGAGSRTVDRSRADQFSVGVMMYEFFTGKRPRDRVHYKSAPGSSTWKAFREPKELAPDILPGVNDIIVKLMSYAPTDRYRDYGRLLSDLGAAKREAKKENR